MIKVMNEDQEKKRQQQHLGNLPLSTGKASQTFLDTFLFWSHLRLVAQEWTSVGLQEKKNSFSLTHPEKPCSLERFPQPCTEELPLLSNPLS